MPQASTGAVCLSCQLRLLSRALAPRLQTKDIRRTLISQAAAPARDKRAQRSTLGEYGLVRKQHANSAQEEDTAQGNEQLDIRSTLDPEAVARHARRRFGDRLPEGALRDEELKVYERMFGTPLTWEPRHEQEQGLDDDLAAEEQNEDDRDILLKEGVDGELEEVEVIDDEALNLEEEIGLHVDDANALIQEDIRVALESEPTLESEEYNADREEETMIDPSASGEASRAHPYTLTSRAGTNPSTIELPKDAFVGPASVLLAETKNKHLDEAAARVLGGPGLPYGTGTPRISRTMPQKPIPLGAYQHRMSSIEADVYLASLMPGYYASSMSVLVELRRRLGSAWIRDLLMRVYKEGGPSILDAGAGGAGALAWRELLRAEIQLMKDDSTLPEDLHDNPGATEGRATVLTGSDELRHRASVLLDNTTFLPRLPDYFHLTPKPSAQSSANAYDDGTAQPQARKQFDIILAPHSVWSINEEWQRRQHIQNLWAMLNPDGGILVLLEKGVPRGFEVIAGARQYILDDLFSNTVSSKRPANLEEESTAEGKSRHAAPGVVIAPCTTQSKCPMYRFGGISKQRKDYCHFSQRYLRPSFFQRLLGAKNRNHEDVKFSYVAVQKGRLPEELGRTVQADDEGKLSVRVPLTGKEATDRAFEGYDVHDSDLAMPPAGPQGTDLQAQPIEQRAITSEERALAHMSPSSSGAVSSNTKPPHPPPSAFTLPHLVLPPLKRPGHVMLDVCTPAGTLERWTVPRSYGKGVYRDARKAVWGDGWALGAKTREYRKVRIGRSVGTVAGDVDDGTTVEDVLGKAKKEEKFTGRLKARSRKRAERRAMKERASEEGAEEELEGALKDA